MSYVLVAGIAVFCFILLYFSNGLAKEHALLKVLSYFFVIAAVILLGKAVIDGGESCELVLNGTTEIYIYGNYFDGYHWDGYNLTAPIQADKEAFLFHKNVTNTYSTVCYDNNTNNTAENTYNLLLGFVIMFFIYVFVYFSYNVISWAGKSFKKR